MVEPQPHRRRIKLGELLVEHRVISLEQLKTALLEQRRSGRKLGRVLADLGLVTETALNEFLARQLQLKFVDLKQVALDRATIRLLPEAQARRFRALVLQQDARGLIIGMADPTDLHALDELQARLRKPVRIALVAESELLKVIDSVYRRTDEIASIAQELREELRQGDVDLDQLTADEGSPDAPVIRLLQSMFHDAVQVRASDIHIEPGENALRIRQRVDGVLQEQLIEGKKVAGALVTRLKLLCGLDIAEKRLPQDGRFSVRVNDTTLDVRVATMPTQFGESVVLRLLDQSHALLSLTSLGMPDEMLGRFQELITRSAGTVLVTGPTGSGKTTTLYAALSHVNDPATKIITVEDPVEYRLDRVNQVQVNAKIGLDFARVLRTALRQDPDIILVGEMRDRETVEIGLRAAMTGHFVFSTLHTINAIATVNRLLDMGALGYMIAASVHAILAQRLVRRICRDCAQPADPSANALAWLASQRTSAEIATMQLRSGAGCTYCNLTGYRGRIGVYELLEMDRPLADAIRRNDPQEFARLAGQRNGYVPLVQRALDLAARGETTLEEAMSASAGIEELGGGDSRGAAHAGAGGGTALDAAATDALLSVRA